MYIDLLIFLARRLFGSDVSAIASGCVLRRTRCQYCGADYVYQLRRTGAASVYAVFHRNQAAKKAAAQKIADQRLQKLLATAHDMIPCPDCGCVQREMVSQRRRAMRGKVAVWALLWLIFTTSLAVIAVAVDTTPAWIVCGLLAALLLAAAVAGFWRFFLADANRHAAQHTRAALGAACHALPAHEFDALTKGQDPFSLPPPYSLPP